MTLTGPTAAQCQLMSICCQSAVRLAVAGVGRDVHIYSLNVPVLARSHERHGGRPMHKRPKPAIMSMMSSSEAAHGGVECAHRNFFRASAADASAVRVQEQKDNAGHVEQRIFCDGACRLAGDATVVWPLFCECDHQTALSALSFSKLLHLLFHVLEASSALNERKGSRILLFPPYYRRHPRLLLSPDSPSTPVSPQASPKLYP